MNTAIGLDQKETDMTSGETAVTAASATPPVGARIIFAHENPEIVEQSRQLFKQASWSLQAHRSASIEDLTESLAQGQWDIVITYASSEVFIPAVVGKHASQAAGSVKALFVDDAFSATNAAQIIQCGFCDYLTTDERDRLLFAIAREIQSLRDHRIASSSESLLADAKAKSQLLLDSTTDAIAYVADGMIIHANNTFSEALQFSAAEDIELLPLIDMVAADDQGYMRSVIKKMSNPEDPIPGTECHLLSPNGQEIAVALEFAAATHEGEPCTQIILQMSGNAGAKTADPAARLAADSLPTVANNDNSVAAIQQLAGKGLIGFVSFSDLALLRRLVGIGQHAAFIEQLTQVVREICPANAVVSAYCGESWLIGMNDDSGDENGTDASDLATILCARLEEQLASKLNSSNPVKVAAGFAKFGIANMDASNALEKAFQLCADLQQSGGGSNVFAPRIDNEEGSAALKSAMELDRLLIKYQPVIGLQNQTVHNYDARIYIRNDSGMEQPATEFIASLGLEKENVALDHWIVSQAITALTSVASEQPETCLCIPVTAAALTDDDFGSWLNDTVAAAGLPKEIFAFDIDSDNAANYEAAAKTMLHTLSQHGFKTSVSNIAAKDINLINSLQPDYAKLADEIVGNLSAEEEENTRHLLKELAQNTATTNTSCVATCVNSAAELAQLWQTGIPFVQGNYLQAPLSTMEYEFSDIA